ncbi:MAG: hypothetical protein H6Q74_2180 [Firmicutes bacterium]|nr:hypothetical protein [Bacillota bacterium]
MFKWMKACLMYIVLPIILIIVSFTLYIVLHPSQVRHEAGRDTREFYGNGNFQIIKSPLMLMDLERKVTLEGPIYAYKEKDSILYVYGETGYTVVDIEKETVRQYVISEENRGPGWKVKVQKNYVDKYVRLNSFDEFTEDEKAIFRTMNIPIM